MDSQAPFETLQMRPKFEDVAQLRIEVEEAIRLLQQEIFSERIEQTLWSMLNDDLMIDEPASHNDLQIDKEVPQTFTARRFGDCTAFSPHQYDSHDTNSSSHKIGTSSPDVRSIDFNTENEKTTSSFGERAPSQSDKMESISVNLSQSGITRSGLAVMTTFLRIRRHIVYIDISHNAINLEGITVLAAQLKGGNLPNICSLDVSYTNSSARAAWCLLDALNGHPRLKKLVLKGNNIGNKGANGLTELLAQTQVLEELDVSYVHSLAAFGAEPLRLGLTKNTCLRILRVEGNDLGNDGASILARGIENHPCLDVLDIGNNGITGYGLPRVLQSLMQCNTLRYLNLSANPLWDDPNRLGALKLHQMLTSRSELLDTLNLQNTRLDNVQRQMILKALKQNTIIRVVLLDAVHASTETVHHFPHLETTINSTNQNFNRAVQINKSSHTGLTYPNQKLGVSLQSLRTNANAHSFPLRVRRLSYRRPGNNVSNGNSGLSKAGKFVLGENSIKLTIEQVREHRQAQREQESTQNNVFTCIRKHNIDCSNDSTWCHMGPVWRTLGNQDLLQHILSFRGTIPLLKIIES